MTVSSAAAQASNFENHPYRTHTCGQLRQNDAGQTVKLSGWIHRTRDHSHLIFVDLRDHYGITQCIFDKDKLDHAHLEALKFESVITVSGQVIERTPETINEKLPTGHVEIAVDKFHIESASAPLPLQVNSDTEFPEDTRLRYRFLDLRRERQHNNIVLRSQIISSLRRRMTDQGFLEIQTPILTASSPEGARDFLVPSRLHPGKFYALPQAPQIFKQLLMVSGFDKYFQIAPCFRDEDARADRSPGEFYQLDLEMSFVTQEDVFDALEPVLHGVFTEFSNGKTVTSLKFPRIPYEESMDKYGCDKPDLRNPLILSDATSIFEGSGFSIFAKAIEKGSIVKAIPAPQTADKPRAFFDKMNAWARDQGAPGLGYVTFDKDGSAKGPIAKLLDEARLAQLKECCNISAGDSVFFACGTKPEANKLADATRRKLGHDLDLLEKDTFRFCWIVDYPMFEHDEKLGHITFSHNPFSMPQGGLEALETQDPLDVKAYQYDIVCNGIELSSGAIRNHRVDIMRKAFEIAGYTENDLKEQFGGMLNALQYGAPPHGGSAPGIDRMVMMLADEPNLREVVAFPMNQQAEDLMMQAPCTVHEAQLTELHIKTQIPAALEEG